MTLTLTLIIIVLTCAISLTALSNGKLYNDLIFYPPSVTYQNQWYRFFTCGLIHADYAHLLFNMYALYMFGNPVEKAFTSPALYGEKGKIFYLVLYFSSLIVCLLPTYFKNKDNSYYRSLGASGAVSAVIFVFIFLSPMSGMGLLFIPIQIPAFLFGFIYLGVSVYLDKRGQDNINHSAHFWGAVYGIAFLIITSYFFTDFRPVERFISQVTGYFR